MDASPRLNVLLYADEADIHLNPHLAYGWYRRGAPRNIPAAGTNQRRSLYGAFNPRTGRLIVHTVRRKSAEGFVQFLRGLLRAYRGKHVFLVADNGPVHTAGLVAQFLKTVKHRLTVIWLPRSSPNLNLIERIWGHLKRSALANIFYGTVARLMVAIARAVRAFNDRSNKLMSLLFADFNHKKSKTQAA